jgi:LPS-assembly lipoprotein
VIAMTRWVSVGLASLSAALLLSACGFTPMYATPGVLPGLSAIEVHVQHGRTAFMIGEDLNDALARDHDTPALYRLEVTVEEQRYPRGLTINNVAQRYEDHVNVTYQLIEIATGKVLKAAVEPIELTYDAANQPYAGVAAQQDSQVGAAEEAAQRIRDDLAAYFARQGRP